MPESAYKVKESNTPAGRPDRPATYGTGYPPRKESL